MMATLGSRVRPWLLPAAGVLVLGAGLLRKFGPAQLKGGRALAAEIAVLEARIAELERQPVVSRDTLEDLLPPRLRLSEVLAKVRAAATRAGLDSLSFATSTEAPAPAAPGGAAPRDDELRKRAKALRSTVELSGDFESVVRFLGMLERGSPLITVDRFSFRPGPEGIEGSVDLSAWWCPRPSKEVRRG